MQKIFFLSLFLFPVMSSAKAVRAVAKLATLAGVNVGTAEFESRRGGTLILIRVKGLSPGEHGMHVHEAGNCDGDNFGHVGHHFNPANKLHGLNSPKGPHAGDLPNLHVKADGSGELRFISHKLFLTKDPKGILKDGGTSVLIHAKPDDEKTDPSGNAGDRIICGVIQEVR